jgi:adenylate cyclase
MFEKATELDPKYADAYVCVGWTYFSDAWNGWTDRSQALQSASEMVQKALALDDSLPAAYQLLSQVDVFKGRHYERGITDAEQAISLDPNSAAGYYWLAQDLDFAGKPEEAIEALNKAMRLDPRNRDYYLDDVAWSYSLMGRYAEAVPLFKRNLARYPNSMGGHWGLAVVYVELGRLNEAQTEAAEVMRLSPQLTLESLKRDQKTVSESHTKIKRS